MYEENKVYTNNDQENEQLKYVSEIVHLSEEICYTCGHTIKEGYLFDSIRDNTSKVFCNNCCERFIK